MSDQRAKTALELFEAALALATHERTSWVERKCDGDAELFAEVKSLLAAHEDASDFLDLGATGVGFPRIVAYDDAQTIVPGRQLGDFLIERQIGAGGMGLVYRAVQVSLKRSVALKVLPQHLHASESARMRFQREIEAAARLRHRNIVAVYTTGEDFNTVYYAMDLIDGPALNQVIDELRRRPLPELRGCPPTAIRPSETAGSTHDVAGDITPAPGTNRGEAVDVAALATPDGYFVAVANLVADVACGLEYAHQMQVIHRDVKPSNLLLSRDGRIHISDFGLARLAEEPGLTRTGEVLGTPFYMAPEQISAAAGEVDARTDVYALGATLYELLTLRPPFDADHREKVISKILREEPTPPRAINRFVPRDLDTICLTALQKDPSERYRSAVSLEDDLRRYVAGLPISARRPGVTGRAAKWVERHRAWAAALAGMCALIVVALFFAYRSHVAVSRWTDAEFGRVYETAQLAALEGDLPRASAAIGEAEKLGAPPAQLALLRGQLALQSGDFQAACDQLESAVRDLPDSLAAHALLINAYASNEQNDKRLRLTGRLANLKPHTLQDYLLLGDAQAYGNFAKAEATLDEAIDRNKTSVVARLTRGGVLILRSEETADAEVAEKALDDLRIAGEMLQPNPVMLGRTLRASLVAATACAASGDERRRQQHLEEAANMADALGPFSGNYRADLWRAVYFDYVGNDDAAIAAWMAGKDHTITFLVPTLFRLGKFQEALDLCDERLARHKVARETEFFRSFVTSATADTPEGFLAAFEPIGKETLDAVNAHRMVYTLRCLAGDLDFAHAYSRNLRASGVLLAADEEPWRKILDYACGDLEASALIAEVSSSRSAQGAAEYMIGITQLASGDRAEARKHFRACSDLRLVRCWEDYMSRALVAQLEREPEWPKWIAAQQDSKAAISVD